MKKFFAICPLFLSCLAVGCIALGGESAQPSGMITLSWESILIVYGPMAIWIVVLVRRNDRHDSDAKDAQGAWEKLLKANTEAMTLVKEALAATKTETEKDRVATYRLIEEVRDMAHEMKNMAGEVVRGNTRVITKE